MARDTVRSKKSKCGRYTVNLQLQRETTVLCGASIPQKQLDVSHSKGLLYVVCLSSM